MLRMIFLGLAIISCGTDEEAVSLLEADEIKEAVEKAPAEFGPSEFWAMPVEDMEKEFLESMEPNILPSAESAELAREDLTNKIFRKKAAPLDGLDLSTDSWEHFKHGYYKKISMRDITDRGKDFLGEDVEVVSVKMELMQMVRFVKGEKEIEDSFDVVRMKKLDEIPAGGVEYFVKQKLSVVTKDENRTIRSEFYEIKGVNKHPCTLILANTDTSGNMEMCTSLRRTTRIYSDEPEKIRIMKSSSSILFDLDDAASETYNSGIAASAYGDYYLEVNFYTDGVIESIIENKDSQKVYLYELEDGELVEMETPFNWHELREGKSRF